MFTLKKLLAVTASVAIIGSVGSMNVFADCEDEDTYVCEEQTDFDLDENQDLEEEEEDIDPVTATAAVGIAAGVTSVLADLPAAAATVENLGRAVGNAAVNVAHAVGNALHSVGEVVNRGLENAPVSYYPGSVD